MSLYKLRHEPPTRCVFGKVTFNLKGELIQTRKRFSEKPIVAFTNSTVFILHVDFCIYMTKPVWSHVLALSALRNHT